MGRYTLDKIQEKELFYQMPKWIYDLDLKSIDREIYMICYDNYKLSLKNGWVNENGEIYFYNSQEKLAEKLKLTKKTIIKSFEKLIELELIEVEKENGKANKYFLIDKETSVKITPVENLHQCKNYTQTSVKNPLVPVENLHPNKNYIITINKNNIDIVEQVKIIKEIVEYLNQKTSSKYKYTNSKTQSLIQARLNEKFEIDDFKKVIDKKTASWLNDTKMAKYLRPETLFGTKFESYLNEKGESRNGTKNNTAGATESHFFREPNW